MKLQDMNSKTKHTIAAFSILGVILLGIIANTNNPERVTPLYELPNHQKQSREPYPPSNPYKAVPYKPQEPSNESLEESEYDIFTEGLDSYYDDPENLDENPDEIFDFLLD